MYLLDFLVDDNYSERLYNKSDQFNVFLYACNTVKLAKSRTLLFVYFGGRLPIPCRNYSLKKIVPQQIV